MEKRDYQNLINGHLTEENGTFIFTFHKRRRKRKKEESKKKRKTKNTLDQNRYIFAFRSNMSVLEVMI